MLLSCEHGLPEAYILLSLFNQTIVPFVIDRYENIRRN